MNWEGFDELRCKRGNDASRRCLRDPLFPATVGRDVIRSTIEDSSDS
jgi:hypothetical protein